MNTLSGEFYLEARPIGSNEVYRSQSMVVTPGARVLWSVENELLLSSYRIVARA